MNTQEEISMNASIKINELDFYTLIKVSGIEASKYLQGQLTIDINAIGKNQHYLTAHCDPKGKVIAVLRLWKTSDECFYYLIPKNLADKQLAEIKKYAIFSKIEFTVIENITIQAVHFNDAITHSNFITHSNMNVINPISQGSAHDNTIEDDKFILNIEHSLMVILINTTASAILIQSTFIKDIPISQSDVSDFFVDMIKRGEPFIDIHTTLEFLPQAINLQALNAISFSKGCYTGQEMVARAKYRGANKRALFILKGKYLSDPAIGEALALKLNDNWRETGTIINFAKSNDTIWLHAVLNKDINQDDVFKLIHDDKNLLTLQSLPYDINE